MYKIKISKDAVKFLAKVKNYIETDKRYKTSKDPDKFLGTDFILTNEHNGNQTIVGFFNLETKKYKRYLIKDVKKFCKTLRFSNVDYQRILGGCKKFKVV